MPHMDEAPRLGAGTPREIRRLASLRSRDTKNPHGLQVADAGARKIIAAKLDALAIWKTDLQHRIAVAKSKLDADGARFFSKLYPDELDSLINGVAAWRLAAARLVIDIDAGRGRRA